MKINFSISEFNISGKSIPEDIADKILKWHIIPIQRVRDKLGVSMWPSQKSGYRSVAWERKQGRSGRSQHTFKGMGAVDWTCRDFKKNKDKLLELFIQETDYIRMAIYNTFIHCDYKQTNSGRREIHDSDHKSRWKLRELI